jgi:hypothetical protein
MLFQLNKLNVLASFESYLFWTPDLQENNCLTLNINHHIYNTHFFSPSGLSAGEFSVAKMLVFSSLADTSTLDFTLGLLSGLRKLCVCANKACLCFAFMSETVWVFGTLTIGAG